MKNSIRRWSQIAFFIIFIFLLVQTEYKGTDQLGQPVRVFLEFDPLLGLAVVSAAQGFIFFLAGIALALGALWVGKKLVGEHLAKNADPAKAARLSALVNVGIITSLLTWAVFPLGLDRSLPPAMLFGLVTIAVTLVLGRVFCGWVCPMGAVLQFAAWLKKEPRKVRIAKNRFQAHQRWKYYLLAGLFVAAVLGFQVIGAFDPISTVIRGFSLVISPLVNQAVNGLYDLAYSTNTDLVTGAADALYNTVAYPAVLSFHQPHFLGSLIVAAGFIGIIALTLKRPRYWCRVLCPLGALLGTVSRAAHYRLTIKKDLCHNCGACSLNCQGACDPEFSEGWRPAECFVCFHCVDSCPTGALKFSFGPDEHPEKKSIGLDLHKRRAFQAAGAALIAVPVMRATEQYKQDTGGANTGPAVTNPALIRPPGALPEPDFLNHCIRCGECMKVCPTNGLHPATLEGGVEGLWTPILVPQIGYCEYYCTLCGQVCPTGAIRELDVQTKIHTVIGTAFFDTNRCLPYAFGTDCMVCEEHCPTAPKAIWFEPVPRALRPGKEYHGQSADPYAGGGSDPYAGGEGYDDAGTDPYAADGGESRPQADALTVLQPRIDLDRCIGCGICEKVCVVADLPAVRVTAVGEQRSAANRITFEGSYEGY